MSTYAGKLLRLNLSTKETKIESVPEEIKKDFLGGRGFGIKYLYDELTPGVDPLSPDNKLLLLIGPLCGTVGPAYSRWVAMAKSPATGGLARSVGGADFGAWLRFNGLDFLIIEGKAEKPAYIYIEGNEARILDAQDLRGLDTQETQRRLRQKHGRQVRVACIGPAGERLVRYAAIVSGLRTASRCGVGAVMGSKNLKAVALSGARVDLTPYNPEAFRDLVRKHLEILKRHKRRKLLTDVGTTYGVRTFHAIGAFPIRNFREGSMDDIEKIFEDQFGKIKVRNVTCYGYVTACGQIHKVTEGPYSGYSSEGPEYETIFSLGGELVNTDIGFLVAADSLCDLYGLDTISTGVCIGFACELFEKGIITIKDTDGLKLTWGNYASFLPLIERIGRREGFGALLGEGAKRAAEQISGAEAYAIHCKGLEMAGYEPRAVKGYALSYAVSNIGASHTYGRPHPDLVGTTDRLAEEGKGDMVASAQREQAITDSVISCGFGSSGITGELRNKTLLAATGIDEFADATYLAKLGERVVCLERAFNVREGFSRKDDTLPARMLTEPLKNAGPATGEVVRRLDSLLDECYDVVGYTRQGIPTPQKLEELGLHLVIRDIEQAVQSQAGRGM